MWGVCDDNRYDAMVSTLEAEVLAYLEQRPELKTTANNEDMWDYRDKDEDVDDPEEDEYEEDYYDDEEDENND